MRLARVLVALVVIVVTVTAFGASAYATVDAGPWDVTATFWKDTSTTLSSRVRVSVDSDDEADGRYKLCVTIHQAGFPDEYSAISLNRQSGTLDTSNTNGLVSREQVPQRSVQNVAVTVDNAKVLAAATTCDASAVGLPIRGRGNVTTVPGDQLGSTDSTPDEPLPSGTPGTDAPAPEVTCSRTLGQEGGNYFATFRSVTDSVAGTTDSWSWDFGDSSTDATTADAQHTYDRETMPDGGWTATLTVTRVGDGITYSEDEVTETCALRVDFLNPSQADPVGGGDFEDEDEDCPTGWGWINPLAIVKVLKCLFVPGDGMDAVHSAGDEFNNGVGSLIGTPIAATAGFFDGLNAGFENGNDLEDEPCEGAEVTLPIPMTDGVAIAPFSSCGEPAATIAPWVHTLGTLSVYVFAALALVRQLAQAIGLAGGF